MDELKDIYKRSWIDQKKVNLKEFYQEWQKLGIEQELEITTEKLKKGANSLFKLTSETICSLEKDLHEDNLTSESSKHWSNYVLADYFECPSFVKLKTVETQLAHLAECKNNVSYRSSVENVLRYRNDKFIINFATKADKKLDENRMNPLEVMLNIQILPPMHSFLYQGEGRKHSYAVADQEFLCLGNQPLTALKDVIVCQVDINVPGDCSDDPNTANKPSASEIYGSSFFFIDNCFYNDMRKTTNADYSEIIRAWASSSSRGIGPMRHAKMEESYFHDLSVRLGQPYVYVHQGDCEHLVIFTEMRIYSPQADSPFVKNYPVLLKTRNRSATRCFVCRLKTAKWLVFENFRLPDDPFLFCQQCLLQFNYTEDMKKIGNFKLYSYLDQSALL